MKVVTIIQARMGSTRLPGKVLLDLEGEPMLVRVVQRSQRAATVDKTIIATTTKSIDEPIVNLCASRSWPCFRGSEDDVLDRYYQAARIHNADIVVRITSDCPLIDPEIIDLVAETCLHKNTIDYASNTLPPRTFPRGLDVEAIRFETLVRAWREDPNLSWREHVTPFIYRHPERFVLQAIINEQNYSDLRWTVDTPEDLTFVQKVYQYFGHDRFTWQQVLAVLDTHPAWLEINQNVEQKMVP